jgi:hypothetical protein
MAGDPADSTATSMLQIRIRDTPAPCPRLALHAQDDLLPLWITGLHVHNCADGGGDVDGFGGA